MPIVPLTENDVVDAVAKHLAADGWTVSQALRTTQPGIDLIATRRGERLVLEAKGGTSTKETSARYGKGFHSGQQHDHVAKAVFVACRLRSREPESRVAIAFPDTMTHRRCLEGVEVALRLLSVWAYVVDEDRQVRRMI